MGCICSNPPSPFQHEETFHNETPPPPPTIVDTSRSLKQNSQTAPNTQHENNTPPPNATFEELSLYYINLYRTNRNAFIDFLIKLQQKLETHDDPPCEKIKFKHWKYKIPLHSFNALLTNAKSLPVMNPLEMNSEIVIPSQKKEGYEFIKESNIIQNITKFDNAFQTNISDPRFAIVMHCLVDNRVNNVFDCGKYDIFNKEGKYVGVEANGKEGGEFMATFSFKKENTSN